MANTKSAIKAIRVIERRTKVNSLRKKAFKDAKKEVLNAIKGGDKALAQSLLPKAYKAIDKAAKKALHKNTAARYKSRLAEKINKM